MANIDTKIFTFRNVGVRSFIQTDSITASRLFVLFHQQLNVFYFLLWHPTNLMFTIAWKHVKNTKSSHHFKCFFFLNNDTILNTTPNTTNVQQTPKLQERNSAIFDSTQVCNLVPRPSLRALGTKQLCTSCGNITLSPTIYVH